MEAQEIILTVWKQKNEMIEGGTQPTRLIMSAADFEKIREYKARLGELPQPEMDYLQEEALFGIPVFIDDTGEVKLE
jgi:hypothetical protein